MNDLTHWYTYTHNNMILFEMFSPQNFYVFYGNGDEPIVNLGMNQFVACMFAVGLAIGVIIAVGGLFYIQVQLLGLLI